MKTALKIISGIAIGIALCGAFFVDARLAGEADRMKRKQYSFDSKCLELAQHFFPRQPGLSADATAAYESVINDFAQDIQDCVEGFVTDVEAVKQETGGAS